MTTPARFPLDRRALLRRLGLGAALVPLLEATRARGAARAYPRRLVIMSKGGGNVPGEFWPQTDAPGAVVPLAATTFGAVARVLEPWRRHLNFVGGLALSCYRGPGDGHLNYGAVLTGSGQNMSPNNSARLPSIDWIIGEQTARRDKLPFPTIAASVAEIAALGLSQVSWRGNGQPNAADPDPYRLFQRVFAGRALGGAPALDRLRAENRSLLDVSARRLEAFARGLGAEDRRKIEQHLSSVRSVEKQLQIDGPACAAPAQEKDAAGARLALKTSVNVPKLFKMQVDIVVAALRCNLTRVATVNIADTFGDGLQFEWLGFKRGYHGIKHKNGQNFSSWADEELKVEPWLLGQFAYLLGELAATPEGGATMLDNTLAFWCDALSNGTNHQFRGMPWVLAGSCGGALRTGQLLHYGGWAAAGGAYWRSTAFIPHNGLLVSIAQAMEVPLNQVGDPAFGAGPLAGLSA